jgi:hypothetical protein
MISKNATKLLSIGALLLAGLSVHAQQASSYQIDVARTQGDISCLITKANGESNVNCTTNVSAESHLAITMNAISGHPGYVGADKVDETGHKFVLAVVADANETLKDVIMIQVQASDDQSFDGSLALTETSSLTAVNVDPIHVEKVSGQVVKLQFSFVAYSPAATAKVLSQPNSQTLTTMIMNKIQPALLVLSK